MYDAPDLQKTEHGEGVKDQGVADGALILQCRTLHTRYCEVWRGGSNAWRSEKGGVYEFAWKCGGPTCLSANISRTDKVWKICRRISSTKLSKLDARCITDDKRVG